MSATDTISKMLKAMPKASDREQLMKAHRAAAEFHNAMGEALEAEREMEDPPFDPFWRAHYQRNLGEAAVAMQKMPVKWLAILNEKIEP